MGSFGSVLTGALSAAGFGEGLLAGAALTGAGVDSHDIRGGGLKALLLFDPRGRAAADPDGEGQHAVVVHAEFAATP